MHRVLPWSGTTGLAAARNSRNFVMIDQNPEACDLMRKRLGEYCE